MALLSYLAENITWASSFKYRDYRLLWIATVFQSVGMGMEHVALGWLVLELTDSAFMVGVASAARMAPFFFLGIVSGAVADKVERRMFLRMLALAGAVVSGITAFVLYQGTGQVWPILLLAMSMGCVWAFTMTMRQAYTFDIVGHEAALNGLAMTSLSQRVGGVMGALAAGLIIAWVGVAGQYAAIAVVYVIGGAVLMFTRSSGQAAIAEPQSVWQNLKGTFHILSTNRILLILMILAAITEVLGFTHQTLIPVLARDELGLGSAGFGVMSAVRQGGGLIGLILLANMGGFQRKGLLMFALAVGFGLGEMAFWATNSVFTFVLALLFINACASGVDTLYKTLMQSNVPNEQRGRAMGSWVVSIGVAPVGHLSLGAIAGVLGAPGALLINGSLLVGVSIATAIGLPNIRRLK
jgi:MFS family permease